MLGGAQTWVGYRQYAFGNPLEVWSSGPDFDVLHGHWLADPVYVEAMLALGLVARDPLAAEALMRLPFDDARRERFARLLTECLDSQSIGFHLRAVEALHMLTADESWAHEVVRVLLGAGFWRDRMDAARVLASFTPTCDIIRAAAQAVEDPDYLVRRQAAETLMQFGGICVDGEASEPMLSGIRSISSPHSWALSARELADLATVHAQPA